MAGCAIGTLICFGCVAVIITIAGGIAYGIQHREENNFLGNLCLVIDAELVTHSCELRTLSYTSEHGKYDGPNDRGFCYAPMWTVLYNETTSSTEIIQRRVRITGSDWRKYANALDELDEYPVSDFKGDIIHGSSCFSSVGWF